MESFNASMITGASLDFDPLILQEVIKQLPNMTNASPYAMVILFCIVNALVKE